MRRLRDFQDVRLSVGGREIEAFVVAVAGEQVTLMVAERYERLSGTLRGTATLHFASGGHVIALSVRIAGLPDGTVYATPVDTACKPEPRRHARVAVGLPATITPIEPAGNPIFTTTVDLSEGGVRVRRSDVEGRVGVFLRIPGGSSALRLEGSVLRNDTAGTVVIFENLGREDLQRLRSIVMSVRRRAVRAA